MYSKLPTELLQSASLIKQVKKALGLAKNANKRSVKAIKIARSSSGPEGPVGGIGFGGVGITKASTGSTPGANTAGAYVRFEITNNNGKGSGTWAMGAGVAKPTQTPTKPTRPRDHGESPVAARHRLRKMY